MLAHYLEMIELGYFEVQFAFEGLADENVWKRPAAGVASVGEMAAHVAYWEAVRFAGDGGNGPEPDLAKCAIKSPLLDHRFRYITNMIETPPSEQHRAMSAKQVYSELVRIHQETMAHLKEKNPDVEAPIPGYPPHNTYKEWLKYAAFHISYHTGEMFLVRHLLGETTPDN